MLRDGMSRLLIMQSWQAGVFLTISVPVYVTPEMIPKLCSEESADRHTVFDDDGILRVNLLYSGM